MLRQSRIDTTGALHHVMARGIERRRIFDDEQDSSDFVENLGLILEQTETTCYAWALLPNHFHLLLKTGPVPIATVMRRLLTGHAVRYNRRHQRHGHLFQNRYHQGTLVLKQLISRYEKGKCEHLETRACSTASLSTNLRGMKTNGSGSQSF